MNDKNINQIEINQLSKKSRYFSIIESILFASGESLNIVEISNIIECDVNYTYNLLAEMKKKYEENERGILLVNTNDNYMLVTKSENSEYIQKLLKKNNKHSLSRAALETLAIIVYRQPVTRVEIDEIRGVKSDKAIETLQDKGLIKEFGRKQALGRPIMYVTTNEFLKYFGLKDLKEMPALEDFLEENESNHSKEEE